MEEQPKFRIFRGDEAPDLRAAGCMTLTSYTDLQKAGMAALTEAGFREGETSKVLVNIPGFSLTYVWFKKDYPLPLHSHDADCLYYIIAGSIELGNETLGPRDSFFVPANGAYAYRPGPDGVEVLEIRHANSFDYRSYAKSQPYYDRALEVVSANLEDWKIARRPSDVDAGGRS